MTLEKLHLTVHIDRDAAILQGHGQVGTLRVPIEPVIAALKDFDAVASVNFSPDTVEWIASHVRGSNGDLEICFDGAYGCNTKRLRSATPEVKMEDLAAQIVRLHSEWIADKRDRQAKAEAEFEAAMAAPIESWIHRDSYSGRPSIWGPEGKALEKVFTEREAYKARQAEAEALLATLLPAWEAEQAAKEAEEVAEKEAKEAKEAAEAERKERAKAALQTWAGSSSVLPHRVRRAANEGMDVRSEVLRLARAGLRTAIENVTRRTLDETGDIFVNWYNCRVREDVPSNEAYALFDALTAATPALAEAAMLPGAKVTVGPFVRVDVAPKGPDVWRSAVRVTLTHEWLKTGTLTLHPLSEPLDYEPSNDNDDDE